MRTLQFIVSGQDLRKDPNCDFDGLVAGSEGYLKAQFTFTSEWDKCSIVARFWKGDEEHAVFLDNGCCKIPPAVQNNKTFKVAILGKHPDGYTMTTNRIIVRQGVRR